MSDTAILKISARGLEEEKSNNNKAPSLQCRVGKTYKVSCTGLKDIIQEEDVEALNSTAVVLLSFAARRLHFSCEPDYWSSIYVKGLQQVSHRIANLGECKPGDSRLLYCLRRLPAVP